MLRVFRTSSLFNYCAGLSALCAGLLFLWPGLLPNLFTSAGFMTHQECYRQLPSLVAMHFWSDVLTGLSYLAISLTLTYLVYRARRDIPFHWVFLAFGLFIIACGGTHFMEAWTTYRAPVYWLAGYVKLITAVASVATAVVLPSLVPKTLALVRSSSPSEREVALRKALAQLRETNQTLQAIIEASPLAVMTLDREGVVKSWNPAAERIYGWPADEVLGQPLPTVPPELRDEMLRNHHAAAAGQSFAALEAKRRRKDGTMIDVNISTAPLLDAAGQADGVVALVADVTERKRIEQASRTSEIKFLKAFNASPEPMIISMLEDGRYLDVNDSFVSVTGYARAEAVGRSTAELNLWANPADSQRLIETLRAEGRINQEQVSFRTKSGEVRTGLFSAEIFEVGGARYVLALTVDITERERVRRALAESEARYRHLAEASPQIFWTARPDGWLDYYNQRWVEYTGMTVEQTQGWGWQPVLHPDDVEKCLRRWATAVETGTTFDIEYRFRCAADGRYRWFLGRAVPMRDDAGRIVKWFGTCTDIDRQKRAAETQQFLSDASTLLTASLDYELILQSLARLCVPRFADYCLVDTLNDDGTIRRLAVAHEDPAREQAWRAQQQRFPLRPGARSAIARILREGKATLFDDISDEKLAAEYEDRELIAGLKSLGLTSGMILPLVARGRTLGAMTFVAAESGRVFTADDLALAEELARRAALAVDNAALYRRAREANRAKDEFLATLSHELRTPLTPIIGWVHLMQGTEINAVDAARGLDVIDKNSQSLSRLINDLLDMSAILSGKMRIDHKAVRLEDVLHEAVETVRPQASHRRVEIDLDISDNALVLNGDRTRLVQVFWNLLTNAVKFSPEGGRVRVACPRDAARAWAQVTIEDVGQGIAADFLPHVFDRFRQADSSTTRTHGGLGIGLALVKSFVEAHGGAVEATSAGEGRGSRFTVRLPLPTPVLPVEQNTANNAGAHALSSDHAQPDKRPDEPAVTPSSVDLSKSSRSSSAQADDDRSCDEHAPSLLLIEDAPDTIEMLRFLFVARGYRVTACDSPAEALRIAVGRRFDIIVSDIGLPNLNGYELLARLRADMPALRDVPAIALSGYAAPKDEAAALDAGFAAHLAKPVDLEELARAVAELLTEHRARASQ